MKSGNALFCSFVFFSIKKKIRILIKISQTQDLCIYGWDLVVILEIDLIKRVSIWLIGLAEDWNQEFWKGFRKSLILRFLIESLLVKKFISLFTILWFLLRWLLISFIYLLIEEVRYLETFCVLDFRFLIFQTLVFMIDQCVVFAI